jgi:hypothetical protein
LAAAFFAFNDNRDHREIVNDDYHDSDLPEEIDQRFSTRDIGDSQFDRNGCAVIYALHAPKSIDISANRSPFDGYTNVMLLNPPHLVQRIVSQDGIFTVFPNPDNSIGKNQNEADSCPKQGQGHFSKAAISFGCSPCKHFSGHRWDRKAFIMAHSTPYRYRKELDIN